MGFKIGLPSEMSHGSIESGFGTSLLATAILVNQIADCKASHNDNVNGYGTCPPCCYNVKHVYNEKCLHCSANKADYDVEEATKSTSLDDVDTIIATVPRVLSKHEYKPLFEINYLIYGPWLDTNKTSAEQTWYPGRIKSFTIIQKKGTYGPIRRYNIALDDRDEIDDVEDYLVFSFED